MKIKSTIAIILLFSIIAFIFTLPIFRNLDNWGILDWDSVIFLQGVARTSILEYHQFPLWNPYYLGGMSFLAHPLSRFIYPAFPLTLLFDVVKAIKIEIWLYLVIGMLGVYWLALHYKLSKPSAVLSAFVFMLNSMYALNLTVGHFQFFPVVYLPWVFLFYLKAFDNLKFSLASGFFLALIFLEGGPYIFMISILFLLTHSFFLVCLRERRAAEVGKLLGVIFVYMLFIGAIKFFPSLELMHRYPRYMSDHSGFSLGSLAFSLLSRNQTLAAINMWPEADAGFINGINYNMDENGMYIGVVPLLLFFLGLMLCFKRKRALVLCFAVFLLFSFGTCISFRAWSALHRFPLYNFMRVAQRVRIVFMLCLSVFVGFGFQAIKDYIRRFIPNKALLGILTSSIILAILIDLMVVSSPIWKDAFTSPPVKLIKSDRFYQIKDSLVQDNNNVLYPVFLQKLGVIAYDPETINIPRNAVPIDSRYYKGEAYLKGTEGKARIIKWSPNRITIDIEPQGQGYLVLNQNYYSGWRAKGNKPHKVESIDGLISVKVFPDEKEIEFSYLPLSFKVGLAVTTVTFLLTVVLIINSIIKFKKIKGGIGRARERKVFKIKEEI